MSEAIYREIIMDHYRNPRNFGELKDPDIKEKDSNPLCGDVIEIQIKLDSNNIAQDVKFSGEGCAISRASASMLTELIKNKSLDELIAISKGDVLNNLGNPELGPSRIKCALLSLKVLKLGVFKHIGTSPPEEADLE